MWQQRATHKAIKNSDNAQTTAAMSIVNLCVGDQRSNSRQIHFRRLNPRHRHCTDQGRVQLQISVRRNNE